MDAAAVPDLGIVLEDSGMGSADTGAEPSDAGADAGVEPMDAALMDGGSEPSDAGAEPSDGGADGGTPALHCAAPSLLDQEPPDVLIGRLGVFGAAGQASALTYTNLRDYSSRVVFHDGTSSTAPAQLFTAAEFNGSGSGDARPGVARPGFAAFLAPRRVNDGSGLVLRRSVATGTWDGPTVGRFFGAGINALALLQDGRVLVTAPANLVARQLEVVTYGLSGSLSATVSMASFGGVRIAATQIAIGPSDHGAVLALTSDGVLHGYSVRSGVVDPSGASLTPPVPANGVVAAALPSGDVYVVWNEARTGAMTRGTTLHYDPGTMETTFGPTEIIDSGSARLDLWADQSGDLTLLRYSTGHLLFYRRIGGSWLPPTDFGAVASNGPDTLALDSEGTAYATFLAAGGIHLARVAAGSSTWELPMVIASPASSNAHAIGALSPRGVVVTYAQPTGVGGGTDIYAVICR